MYFTYIDWVKERMTRQQKAEINMLENEFDRIMKTASIALGEDKETLFEVMCSYNDKMVQVKHKYFEMTRRRLEEE